jgi:hypothetical protein
MTTTTYIAETFEMLWNCPACGTKKLLGVTHRFCPNCGHQQHHERRYFPTPGERTPTPYLGFDPDMVCSSCNNACSSKLSNCHGCGASLSGAKTVHVRPSIPAGQGETGAKAKADHEARKAARRAEQIAGAATPGVARAARVAAASADAERRTPTNPYVGRAKPGASLRDLYPDTDHITPPRRFQPEPYHWVIGAFLLVAALLATCVLWKRDATLEVTGHHWERAVEVERFVAVNDRDWCTSKPIDAYNVSRRSELHHTDRIPDGQDCRMVQGSCTESCSNRDNGNGSGSRVCTKSCEPARRECTTRYRSEPVYAQRCYYIVDRWRTNRTARANGSSLAPEPVWPSPTYRGCTGSLGCERLGARTATYEVHLVEPGKKEHQCEFAQPKWASFSVGQAFKGEVGVISGSLDCDSLREPTP